MDANEKLKVLAKLGTTRNVYREQQKAEALKRRRDEEAAANVYQEFVESFTVDDDGDDEVKDNNGGGKRQRRRQRRGNEFVKGGVIAPSSSSTPSMRAFDPDDRPSAPKSSSHSTAAPMFVKPSSASSSSSSSSSPPKPHTKNNNNSNKKRKSIVQPPAADLTAMFGTQTLLKPLSQTKTTTTTTTTTTKRKGPRQIDSLFAELKRAHDGPNTASASTIAATHDRTPSPASKRHESTNIFFSNMHPFVTERCLMDLCSPFGPVNSVKIMWPRSDDEFRRHRNTGFVSFVRRTDAAKAIQSLTGRALFDREIRVSWGKSMPSDNDGDVLPVITNPSILNNVVGGPGQDMFPYDTVQLRRYVEHSERPVVVAPGTRGGPIVVHRGERVAVTDVYPHLLVAADSDSSVGTASVSGCSNNTNTLSSHDRAHFGALLDKVTVNRADVMECMGFALDNAMACTEIVDMVVDALMAPGVPMHSRLARLFVISDILYNTNATVKNSSAYRSGFQARLHDVFLCLHAHYKSIGGRISANTVKEKVVMVLRVWQAWNLFPGTVCTQLEQVFLTGTKSASDTVVSEALAKIQQIAAQAASRLAAAAAATATNHDNDAGGNVNGLGSSGKRGGGSGGNGDDDDMDTSDDDIDGVPFVNSNNRNKNNVDVDDDDDDDDDDEEFDIDGIPMTDEDFAAIAADSLAADAQSTNDSGDESSVLSDS